MNTKDVKNIKIVNEDILKVACGITDSGKQKSNIAKNITPFVSSNLENNTESNVKNLIDGNRLGDRWISDSNDKSPTVEIKLPEIKNVVEIRIYSGYKNGTTSFINNVKIYADNRLIKDDVVNKYEYICGVSISGRNFKFIFPEGINRIYQIEVYGLESIKEPNILWQKNIVPGSTKLIGGNEDAGFYGEVSSKDFINGDELANRIGLTAGKSQYSNEPWLKFSYMGKIEFIAKKPYRNEISWNDLDTVNAVYGNRIIEIKNSKYRVRLIKGKTEGKQKDISDYLGKINHNSEWNRLILPIHELAPSSWHYKGNVNMPTDDWGIDYNDSDLITGGVHGEGEYSWCMEYGGSTNNKLVRGSFGPDCSVHIRFDDNRSSLGWRPVLELVGRGV